MRPLLASFESVSLNGQVSQSHKRPPHPYIDRTTTPCPQIHSLLLLLHGFGVKASSSSSFLPFLLSFSHTNILTTNLAKEHRDLLPVPPFSSLPVSTVSSGAVILGTDKYRCHKGRRRRRRQQLCLLRLPLRRLLFLRRQAA